MKTPDELPGMVRARDPETSWKAAERTVGKRHAIRLYVMDLLRRNGPLTDEELFLRYSRAVARGDVPASSPQAVRTERSRLHVAGLVRDTGDRKTSTWGRSAIVWAAQEETSAAAPTAPRS